MERAIEVYHDMARLGVRPNVFTFGALMDGLSRDIQRAAEKGDRKRVESRLAQCDQLQDEMRHAGVKPDEIMFNSLVSACGRAAAVNASALRAAFAALREMKALGVPASAYTYSSIIDGCTRGGEPARGLAIWDEACSSERPLERTPELVGAAAHACAATGDLERAMSIYRDSLAHGLKPDGVLFAILMARAASNTHQRTNSVFPSLPFGGQGRASLQPPGMISFRRVFTSPLPPPSFCAGRRCQGGQCGLCLRAAGGDAAGWGGAHCGRVRHARGHLRPRWRPAARQEHLPRHARRGRAPQRQRHQRARRRSRPRGGPRGGLRSPLGAPGRGARAGRHHLRHPHRRLRQARATAPCPLSSLAIDCPAGAATLAPPPSFSAAWSCVLSQILSHDKNIPLPRCGDVERASKVFDRMIDARVDPPLEAFVSMVAAYAQSGQLELALEWKGRMDGAGHGLDDGTARLLLGAAARCGDAEATWAVWRAIRDGALPVTEAALNTVLGGCLRRSRALESAAAVEGPEGPSRSEKQEWERRAVGAYVEATSSAGVVPRIETLSTLLACLRQPQPRGLKKTVAGSAAHLSPATNAALASAHASSEAAGRLNLYPERALSLFEDAQALGVVPRFTWGAAAEVDLRQLPPAAAEVCVLTLLRVLRRRRAASGDTLVARPIRLRVCTLDELVKLTAGGAKGASLRRTQTGVRVTELLRRLSLRFSGAQSWATDGLLEVDSDCVADFLQQAPQERRPIPLPGTERRLPADIQEQARRIRLRAF